MNTADLMRQLVYHSGEHRHCLWWWVISCHRHSREIKDYLHNCRLSSQTMYKFILLITCFQFVRSSPYLVQANPNTMMGLSPQLLTTWIINISIHGDIQNLWSQIKISKIKYPTPVEVRLLFEKGSSWNLILALENIAILSGDNSRQYQISSLTMTHSACHRKVIELLLVATVWRLRLYPTLTWSVTYDWVVGS